MRPVKNLPVRPSGSALFLTFTYAVIASVWILASDEIAGQLERLTGARLHTYKGLAFVAVTAVLLYYTLLVYTDATHETSVQTARYSSRLRRLVIGIGALVGLLLIANAGLNAWSGRRDALSAAELATMNLARLLEAHLGASIQGATASLATLAAVAATPDDARRAELLRQLLARRELRPSFVQSLSVLDTGGNVVQSSDPLLAGRNFRDRPYFTGHANTPDARVDISDVLTGRVRGTPAVVISRGTPRWDGVFGGVAIAVVNLDYVQSVFEALRIGKTGSVSLIRRDGQLIARWPRLPDGADPNIAGGPLLTRYLPASSAGSFEARGFDGVPRLFSYRAVADTSLVVVVGLTEAEILEGWGTRAVRHALTATGFVALALWLTALVLGGLKRQAHSERALRERQIELASATEKLQGLSKRLLQVQEDERRALSRELHDDIGQTLTLLVIELKTAHAAVPPDAERIESCVDLAQSVLDQVRDISLALRPALLDELGLEAAMRSMLHRFAETCGWDARFAVEGGVVRYTPELEIVCYRIAQEALTNISRHAGATRVDVTLKVGGNVLELTVRDDGRGIEPPHRRSSRGIGLASMQERAELVGGTLQVRRAEGGGTEVIASLPLHAPAPQH